MPSTCKGVAAGGEEEPGAARQSDGHRGAPSGEQRRQGPGVQEWLDGSRYTAKGGVAAASRRAGGEEEPAAARQSDGQRGAPNGDERRQGLGVQEWPDGSRYEGEFVKGLKHGKGRYTWRNGEFYEGSFYKDYRHGDGLYCWPSGHKFTGKFYLNRKEGYAEQRFPDGATFQGLYHTDQRFGPGVMSYPDGRQDVGLWLGERLLRLCTSVKEGFSLKNFPEYAAFMDPAAITDSLTQPPADGHHTERSINSEVDRGRHLVSDETFIYPPGMERYSTNGDFLPLPPGRRRELDWHCYGELWKPDAYPYEGYERDPLSTLPLQARMQAHIHKHRLQAKRVDWDVAAVLSQKRKGFGPKGPLEVHSELLIQHSSRGERQAVSKILQTGLVHPDVADSQGHTALIAATVNCHNDVIHMLLDMGVDIDKLNCEGMSALAVCHVLYYPFQSLYTTLNGTFGTTQGLNSPSGWSSLQISQVDFTTDMSRTAGEATESILRHSSNNSDSSITERWPGRKKRKEKEGEGKEQDCKETEMEGKVREREEERRQTGESEGKGKREEDVELGVQRCIQVLDGHMTLGSVQRKERRDKAAGRVQQGEDKELTLKPTVDSAHSVSSYDIQVTEEVMQRSSEALSRIGFSQRSDTSETVHKLAAMTTEHRVRNTLKLLLERGADPNETRVPLPILILAIMAADDEAVRRLLLCGARTDIPLPPEKKGLHPLHVAAAMPGPAGPRITELLVHAITDPDARAYDQDEIYEPDEISMTSQEPLSTDENPHLKEGGRTALHVACQRRGDYRNASKVVALLLSHRARTDLLWSGHSPLSLAIASGNDLAVEELLKGGADPSIPLGRGVGSALCAIANINYHLAGMRATKLLDMLAKAGADILLPVKVGDTVGTAVDYAYYSFNRDLRIANTPFHALNLREREIFKDRRQLLSMMADLLRQTVCQKERENLEKEQHLTLTSTNRTDAVSSNVLRSSCGSLSAITEKHRKPVFKYCYQCGRSVFVSLSACTRCRKVFYCSRTCKLSAWEERHKEECNRVSAFKSPRGFRSSSARQKSPRSPKPKAKEVELKENYSCN